MTEKNVLLGLVLINTALFLYAMWLINRTRKCIMQAQFFRSTYAKRLNSLSKDRPNAS